MWREQCNLSLWLPKGSVKLLNTKYLVEVHFLWNTEGPKLCTYVGIGQYIDSVVRVNADREGSEEAEVWGGSRHWEHVPRNRVTPVCYANYIYYTSDKFSGCLSLRTILCKYKRPAWSPYSHNTHNIVDKTGYSPQAKSGPVAHSFIECILSAHPMSGIVVPENTKRNKKNQCKLWRFRSLISAALTKHFHILISPERHHDLVC